MSTSNPARGTRGAWQRGSLCATVLRRALLAILIALLGCGLAALGYGVVTVGTSTDVCSSPLWQKIEPSWVYQLSILGQYVAPVIGFGTAVGIIVRRVSVGRLSRLSWINGALSLAILAGLAADILLMMHLNNLCAAP